MNVRHRLLTKGRRKTARAAHASPPPLLDSAAAIWTFLRTEGGLNLEFHADMDGEILAALKTKLGLDAVLPVRYRCYVHNYRPSVSIGLSAAHVTITLGRSTAELPTPIGGEAAYWHLFDYACRAESGPCERKGSPPRRTAGGAPGSLPP